MTTETVVKTAQCEIRSALNPRRAEGASVNDVAVHTEARITVEQELSDLLASHDRLVNASVRERVELAERCIEGVMQNATEWVDESCRAKGIADGSPCRAEEILSGPIVTVRFLRLLIQSLESIGRVGVPTLPSRVRTGTNGQLQIPVMPVKGLFDPIIFINFRAQTWMQSHVTHENLHENLATSYKDSHRDQSGIALILGAGNVSGIPVTDALSKIFIDNQRVLLKMHPVNEYLGPIFERSFAPLIENGFMKIVYGGADVGAAAINHDAVDAVHITGAIESHDAIVWGQTSDERERRKRDNYPILKKPISSELGNVSPWAIVPGKYSTRQLRFQAENVAASLVNNAAFNCVGTRVILTWKHWPQREQFLAHLQQVLDQTPTRNAYYPGAVERFFRFTGNSDAQSNGELPWTLIRDVNADDSPQFLEEESFASVSAEIPLDASSEQEFLSHAVDFMNDRLWGTLCAALTVAPSFRRRTANKQLWDQCLTRLRYGSIGINHWPGLLFAVVSSPWGGFPGSPLADVQSGTGWVHNSYMLDGAEKTVLEGPIVVLPKPIWMPTHKDPEPIAWSLLRLYHRPSLWNMNVLTTLAITKGLT